MKGTGKTHSKLYNRGKSGKKLYPRLLNSAFIYGSQSHFCKFVLLSEAKRTSCCCTCSATPRKSPIFCDPEAKLGQLCWKNCALISLLQCFPCIPWVIS